MFWIFLIDIFPLLHRDISLPVADTCVVILCSGKLLPELFCVIWVELIVKRGAEPFGLQLVQHRCHRIGDINNAAGLTGHHKQEAISSFQD